MRPEPPVLAVLRAALPGVTVVSVVPDVDERTYPMVEVRRAGGTRNPDLPTLHSRPGVELTAVSDLGPIEAEELYEAALDALFDAVRAQTASADGCHVQSIRETSGAAPARPEAPDTWAVEGSMSVSLRRR